MGEIKAKFYCPSCKRFFGEDELSPEISALLRDSGEQMPVCKECSETLEYALWRPLVKHYWKFQKEELGSISASSRVKTLMKLLGRLRVEAFIDSNVILRYLCGDIEAKKLLDAVEVRIHQPSSCLGSFIRIY